MQKAFNLDTEEKSNLITAIKNIIERLKSFLNKLKGMSEVQALKDDISAQIKMAEIFAEEIEKSDVKIKKLHTETAKFNLSSDIDNFDLSMYNPIRLSKGEYNNLLREAMTWDGGKKNQLLSRTLLNEITYFYYFDDLHNLIVLDRFKSKTNNRRNEFNERNKRGKINRNTNRPKHFNGNNNSSNLGSNYRENENGNDTRNRTKNRGKGRDYRRRFAENDTNTTKKSNDNEDIRYSLDELAETLPGTKFSVFEGGAEKTTTNNVEEYFQSKTEPDNRRFHNLKYIEKVAEITPGRTFDRSRSGVSVRSISTTTFTVSDLFSFVNKYDEEFKPHPVNNELLNEDGTPKELFHGTKKFGFTVFDPNASDDKTTLFFTDDKLIASTYSGKEGVRTLKEKPILVTRGEKLILVITLYILI